MSWLGNLRAHLKTLRNLTRSRLELERLSARIFSQAAIQRELETRIEALAAENSFLRGELARMEELCERGGAGTTRELVRMSRRVENLESARSPSARNAGFYRDFEDRYRGSRQEIRRRLRSYLPRLAFLDGAGETANVVDLGCGRGEWLELLREHGIEALGVDSNPQQTLEAREAGYRIETVDVLSWIDAQQDASVDVLSAFHLLEHMEFPALMTLLSGAFRVLKPSGLLLLETPNPESLIVGAYKFWLDPTHLRPYPPQLLEQMLAATGFTSIEIARMRPDGRKRSYQSKYGLAAPIADLLVGPLDYAVSCRRPGL